MKFAVPSLNGRFPGEPINVPGKDDRGGWLGNFRPAVLAGLLLVLFWPTPASTTEICYVKDTTVMIPFLSCTKNQEIRQFLLYVSDNNGEGYKVVGKAKPSDMSFRYNPPGQGIYWFVVQAEYANGKRFPADPDTVEPGLKVYVDSTPPVVTLSQVLPQDIGTIAVKWEITEEHPDYQSLRLDYRFAREGPVIGGDWIPLDSYLPLELRGPQGQLGWTPEFNATCEVRLSVSDRAGNTTERLLKVAPTKTLAKSKDTQERNDLKKLEEKLSNISDEVDELKKKLAAVAEKLARTEGNESEQSEEAGSSSESPEKEQEIILRKVDGRWVVVNPDVAAKKSQTDPTPVPSCVMVGNRLENMALRTLGGDTWEYKRNRKGRLLLLSFWSTTCAPCLRDLPNLCELRSDFGRYGLEVLGIACESGLPDVQAQKVRSYRSRHVLNFITLLGGGGSGACPVRTQFQVDMLPRVFLLDESGNIVWKSGRDGLSAEKLRELRQEITMRLRVQ